MSEKHHQEIPLTLKCMAGGLVAQIRLSGVSAYIRFLGSPVPTGIRLCNCLINAMSSGIINCANYERNAVRVQLIIPSAQL